MIQWKLLLHSAIVIIHQYCGLSVSGSGNPGLDLWYCSSS